MIIGLISVQVGLEFDLSIGTELGNTLYQGVVKCYVGADMFGLRSN